jgi:hypothetical protein
MSCVVPHLIQTRTLYHGKSKREGYPEPQTKRQGRRILFDVTDQPSAQVGEGRIEDLQMKQAMRGRRE